MAKMKEATKEKIIQRLRQGPANVSMLSIYADCTFHTARIHVADLERDQKITSENLGNQRVYWMKDQYPNPILE